MTSSRAAVQPQQSLPEKHQTTRRQEVSMLSLPLILISTAVAPPPLATTILSQRDGCYYDQIEQRVVCPPSPQFPTLLEPPRGGGVVPPPPSSDSPIPYIIIGTGIAVISLLAISKVVGKSPQTHNKQLDKNHDVLDFSINLVPKTDDGVQTIKVRRLFGRRLVRSEKSSE